MKYTIVCDWVEFYCRGVSLKINDIDKNIMVSKDLNLIRNLHNTNPGFCLCFYINYKDEIYGSLFYEQTGKYRFEDKDLCLIKVENYKLYESGFADTLKEILEKLELSFFKLAKLHIAIDGANLLDIHKKLCKTKTFKRKRAVAMQTTHDKNTVEIVGYRLGSAKADKNISLYRKAKEIKEQNKTYIMDFWKKNELKGLGVLPIDRLELRLNKAKYLAGFDDLEKLEDEKILAATFKMEGAHFLTFFDKKKTKQKSIIDWAELETCQVHKQKRVKHEPFRMAHLTTIKILVQEYYVSKNDVYMDAALDLANDKKLAKKVQERIKRWLDDS